MFDLDLIENNKIKITYKGDVPVEVKILPLLSNIRIPVANITFKFNNKNHWFVPNIDYTGCSYLRLEWENQHIEYFLPLNIHQNLNKKPHNVICLGLNKTGTTSLKAGLEDLGYDVMWEALGHQFIQADVWGGDYSSLNSIVKNPKFNAYEDLPFSLRGIYKEVFKIDPKAKYILTIRDVNKWVNSTLKWYNKMLKDPLNSPFKSSVFYSHNYANSQTINIQNWFKPLFDSWGISSIDNLEEQLKEVYITHTQEIIEFFKQNEGNLLMLDVSKPGSFKQMAEFLGEETNKIDFPWLNKAK